ncbi:hypothetical protein [Streptomyces sp. AC495_CC817]|uniref:hypothetical protein n=1 Tax=Streptomyces sp. AC495_CC817 TaxID=2823900 RepID=UPI0020B79A70|nr:hypothetical protein [Streptomyces sp. AC495_CC817]
MTRTPPTTVELALIAEVSRCGLTVTHHQFERWRAKRWLAPADQWTDPATGALRYDIVHRAAWLAALSRPGRAMSLDRLDVLGDRRHRTERRPAAPSPDPDRPTAPAPGGHHPGPDPAR